MMPLGATDSVKFINSLDVDRSSFFIAEPSGKKIQKRL